MDVITTLKKQNELILEGRRLCCEVEKLAEELAYADREYRAKKSALTLRYLAQKEKATVIPDIVRGHPDVVESRLQLMLIKGKYKAKQEKILYNKLQLNVLRDDLQREWGNTK